MPTQAERRATTRAALLDAAVATLVQRGATGFTTLAVAGTAGLSNGALFRYFPTRLDLVASTVEHVLGELRDTYARRFDDEAPVAHDPVRLLELLWDCMSDVRLAAVYELYTQCRTDDHQLAAVQPIVIDHVDRVAVLAASVIAAAGRAPANAHAFVTLAIMSMQGLVINNLAGTSLGVERDLIVALAAMYHEATGDPTP